MSTLITLNVAGRHLDWDTERITGTELREMKRKYGLTLKTLMPEVADTEPDALACFWWLLVRQNGSEYDSVPLNDDLDFPAGALVAALMEKADDDEPEEAGPDPTQASSSRTGSTASPEPSTPKAMTRPPRGSQRSTGSSSESSPETTSG